MRHLILNGNKSVHREMQLDYLEQVAQGINGLFVCGPKT